MLGCLGGVPLKDRCVFHGFVGTCYNCLQEWLSKQGSVVIEALDLAPEPVLLCPGKGRMWAEYSAVECSTLLAQG